MHGKHLFEYAVIRVVPKVEREEFLNVGVVLYCGRPKFLQAVFEINENRLLTLSPELDIAEICAYLNAFEQICKGDVAVSPIAKLPIAERFRWLTATRSTIVQSSKVHSGFSDDLSEMHAHLHQQLVLL